MDSTLGENGGTKDPSTRQTLCLVATLIYEHLKMYSKAGIDTSQGSMAKRFGFGGIFSNHFVIVLLVSV